jgi:mono/diheme cytochrome c family protein
MHWRACRSIALFFVTAGGCAGATTFDSAVQPIFQAKCLACHGAAAMGKLDLRTPESVLKGGESGPVVMPGAADKSLLIDKVVTQQMPPGKVKMTDAEIDIVRNWINKELAPPAEATAEVSGIEALAIFQARCVTCHGGLRKEGGLDLRTVASRLKGGKSGPALVPGKPLESLLYKRMVNGQMPPDIMAKDLAVELPTDAETEKIKTWIAEGAPAPVIAAVEPMVKDSDRQWWSFQPPVRPAVPAVKNQALVRNPLDAFLLQKLEAKGLKYSTEAGKLQLMRRVYLDLTGLPPTPAEIAEYETDHSRDAYEKLVDRLLASPHYGERWGQHWLDLAGYSDSEGFGQDDGVRPFAWRYRDYVIRALNADKPYDRFLTEQIAGDEMSDDWKKAGKTASQETIDRLAATGFLRNTPDPTDSNERGLIAERMNVLADEVEVLSSSVMGMTVGCARCHNHKYDPIPQRDYYRMSAILQSAYDPYEWRGPRQRTVKMGLAQEQASVKEHNAPIEAKVAKLKEQIEKESAPYRAQLGEKIAAEKIDDAELQKRFPDLKNILQPIQKDLDAERQKLKPEPYIRVLSDNAEPSQSYLLRRGDPVGFGEPVEAGVPTVLENAALKPYRPVSPYAGASGRRLALAQWLTQPNHPLTARVAVNQLWLRHFGRGIVPSVSNFGHSGAAPSNLELLDWLATEFVSQGWSMKHIHRLIVTSEAYRQTSHIDAALLAADPDNELLSRMPLERMDAETLYDSLLTVTGRLDPLLFGEPVDVKITPEKEVTVKGTPAGYRRAIYVLHRRQTPMSLLDAFDEPAMTPNCTERRRSNVATQALHMMNGSQTWELARYMAGRIIDEAGDSEPKQIELIYTRAFARKPSPDEIKIGEEAIATFRKEWPARLASDNQDAPRQATTNWMALANYCHAILNSAEFSFID